MATPLAILSHVFVVSALVTTAAAQTPPPSDGPALGMPIAFNSRDAQGNTTNQLGFKEPGLNGVPKQVTTPLPGPGGLVVTPEALGWSGPRWQNVTTTNPGPQFAHIMVSHPSGQGVAMLTSGGLMWSRTNGVWSSGTTWPARGNSAAACDIQRGVVVMFGGHPTPIPPDGTWEWDGSSWSEWFPANSPPQREHHAMAYDSARGVTVLFGGLGAWPGMALSDTWEWDGTNWTQVVTPNAPPARFRHRMTYDAARARIVLFGGAEPGNILGDTWEYDGTDWTQKTQPCSPPPRYLHAMAYDPIRQRVMLHGGALTQPLGTSVTAADTWQFDGNRWCELQSTPSMPARTRHAMAFDHATGELIMHGGVEPGPLLADTWTLDQTTHPLPINDFSFGLDWIPADDQTAGLVDVPDLSWIGMAFAVREGTIGAPGSRLAQEPSAGIGTDVFAYVFDDSDQQCLPGHQVGEVTRAANSDEGIVGSGDAHQIHGLDVFLPAYENLDATNYTGHPLPPEPSIYFTVGRDGLDRAPTSWWAAGTRSAATILVSKWHAATASWSCPRVWRNHDEIRIPDPSSKNGYSELAVDEEIDALAIGRNDGLDGEPTYMLFSTNRSAPGLPGGVTKAPDQLMITSPGGLDGPLLSLALRVIVAAGQPSQTVSDRIGLGNDGDVSACTTWDPCTHTVAPPARGYFAPLFGAYTDPAPLWPLLATIPIGDGTVYRDGTGSIVAVTSRPNGAFGMLWISPDVNNPSVGLFPYAVAGMSGDTAEIVVPIPAGLIGSGTGMLHWLTIDTTGSLDRSSVLFEF